MAADIERLERVRPANLWRAGSGGEGGVDEVYVIADIDRLIVPTISRASAMTSANAALKEFLDPDGANAVRLGKIEIFGVVHGPAQADLDDALGVQKPLFHGAAEGGAMGVQSRTRSTCRKGRCGCRKWIMPRGAVRGDATKDRQGTEVIAARCQGPDA